MKAKDPLSGTFRSPWCSWCVNALSDVRYILDNWMVVQYVCKFYLMCEVYGGRSRITLVCSIGI